MRCYFDHMLKLYKGHGLNYTGTSPLINHVEKYEQL